jgi:BASS family bile acid:Na+ symporter
MEIADLMGALFNASLTIMIVATMFAAGLMTTFSALGAVFKNVWLLVLVLITALVLRPLVGWGLAEVFGLATASYIAMLLLAACPGAPLGAKFVMTAGGDLTTGASLQVVLAAIGSITFPLTANLMITNAGLGEDISLPVADLIKAVAFLQLVPFVAGILVRHWTPKHAMDWRPPVQQVSTYTLLIVIALALLGSWRTIIDMIGDRVLLAQALFVIIVIALGWFLSRGDRSIRKATSLIEGGSNAGPIFAAIAIGFNNDPEILGITTALIFVQIVLGTVIASYMGKDQAAPEEAGDEAPANAESAEAPAEAQPA